jgi:hypothetical protein
MRPNDVRVFLQDQPFQPFRITLTDGRTYEIRHPEFVMVGRSSLVIGFPAPGEADEAEPIYDRFVTVSLLHVMQMEPLQTSGASNA